MGVVKSNDDDNLSFKIGFRSYVIDVLHHILIR